MATAKASPSGAHLDDICHSLLFELGWMVLVRVVRVVRPPAFSTELEKKKREEFLTAGGDGDFSDGKGRVPEKRMFSIRRCQG